MLRWLGRVSALLLAAAGVGGVVFRWLLPPAVTTIEAIRGPAVQAVYATGTVEAGVTIRIAPRVAGRLTELGADEGQDVVEGQVLARLEDSDLRSMVAELEAKARYAEQQFARSDALYRRGYVTRDRVDQARSELDVARAAVRRVVERLGFMTLRSPADGRVIRRDGEVGDFIPVNQTLFYLAKAGMPPRIEADVEEEDIAEIRSGQKVLIKADAFADRVFEGRVTAITPKGDPIARSYRVRIGLPADTALMIGMTVEANIIIAERQMVLLVPSTAVTEGAVWLVRDGRLVRQPVQIGARGPDRTEIIAGLTEIDKVLVEPPEGLTVGDAVRAESTESPASAFGSTPESRE